MANEAVLFIETQVPISMTCSNTVGIERGSLLKLTDPMTVSAPTALNDIVGGIAAGEKIASDGKTKIEVYRSGFFKVVASGSITVGDPLVIADPTSSNVVQTAGVSAEQIIGISMETATNGETFIMELKPFSAQLA